MKIFGYEFRKFEESNTTIESVETYVVEWDMLKRDIINKYEPTPMFKTFIDRSVAESFYKEIEACIQLLGDRGRKLKIYKQKSPTNKV